MFLVSRVQCCARDRYSKNCVRDRYDRYIDMKERRPRKHGKDVAREFLDIFSPDFYHTAKFRKFFPHSWAEHIFSVRVSHRG